jgi:hypothetical protein
LNAAQLKEAYDDETISFSLEFSYLCFIALSLMSLLTHVRLPVEIESVMNMQKTYKSKINNKSSAKEKKRARAFVRAKIEASLFNSFDASERNHRLSFTDNN